jgi:hypothetical protein
MLDFRASQPILGMQVSKFPTIESEDSMNEENRLVPTQTARALSQVDITALDPVAVYELATSVVAAIDLIAAIIPDLRIPHPATAKKVRGARTVPREAVVSIVAMVEAWPGLLANMMDTGRAREVLEFDHNFRVLDERIERLRRQVTYTAEARWAEVTMEAMNAYDAAKRYAKDPRYADLAAHVAVIRGHLDRRNGKTAKKKKERDPQPE